ncbi:uncharacterized protein [Hyperolius riggenbachi]|uniref:uncharacterized protein isoform X2 n=1 Tax=Hyperolius riggenbachi TaxID=752182 RepID=UPI0035A3AD3E
MCRQNTFFICWIFFFCHIAILFASTSSDNCPPLDEFCHCPKTTDENRQYTCSNLKCLTQISVRIPTEDTSKLCGNPSSSNTVNFNVTGNESYAKQINDIHLTYEGNEVNLTFLNTKNTNYCIRFKGPYGPTKDCNLIITERVETPGVYKETQAPPALPPGEPTSKTGIILGVVGILALLIVFPLAVYLIKKRNQSPVTLPPPCYCQCQSHHQPAMLVHHCQCHQLLMSPSPCKEMLLPKALEEVTIHSQS